MDGLVTDRKVAFLGAALRIQFFDANDRETFGGFSAKTFDTVVTARFLPLPFAVKNLFVGAPPGAWAQLRRCCWNAA